MLWQIRTKLFQKCFSRSSFRCTWRPRCWRKPRRLRCQRRRAKYVHSKTSEDANGAAKMEIVRRFYQVANARNASVPTKGCSLNAIRKVQINISIHMHKTNATKLIASWNNFNVISHTQQHITSTWQGCALTMMSYYCGAVVTTKNQ